MYIHEAAKQARLHGGCITRQKWHDANFYCRVAPTDTPDGCVLLSRGSRWPSRGWQPTAEDLTADDWFLLSRQVGPELTDSAEK